jgi:hypothetical protein
MVFVMMSRQVMAAEILLKALGSGAHNLANHADIPTNDK